MMFVSKYQKPLGRRRGNLNIFNKTVPHILHTHVPAPPYWRAPGPLSAKTDNF
jgi:hypothetical protein